MNNYKINNHSSIAFDDHTFFYSQEAIDDNCDIIGFYFDDCNHPQPILRESVYGDRIIQFLFSSEQHRHHTE